MAFAAPMAGRVAAGAAARSAGAGAAAKAGSSAAKAGGAGKASRAAAAAPPKATKAATAPERARELRAGGMGRDDVARVMRDEYGSTVAEGAGLFDAAESTEGTGGGGPTPPSAPPASTRPAPRLPGPPRVARKAADAGGGVILGTLTYVLALNYLRGGSEGVKRWMAAKFLNRVTP